MDCLLSNYRLLQYIGILLKRAWIHLSMNDNPILSRLLSLPLGVIVAGIAIFSDYVQVIK